jgi:hypothetical protein
LLTGRCGKDTADARPLTSAGKYLIKSDELSKKFASDSLSDRPVFIVGSGRCGSTLLQSILNTNPDFLIWGEHNGFLRQLASAYFEAAHPRFPDHEALSAAERIKRLRDPRRWPAWDNLCGETGFRARFQSAVRSFFADPEGLVTRWGFKEIRYPRDSDDRTLEFLLDCFPEARLVILVREPRATIFSMLSRWAFSEVAPETIDDADVDCRIASAAQSWNWQYSALHRFARGQCMVLRYEDLGSAGTYRTLATFLDAAPFHFKRELAKVKDRADKSGPAAIRIRERMLVLEPLIEDLTREMSAIYGYAPVALAD